MFMNEQTIFDSFAEFNTFRAEPPSLDAEEWSEADTRSKQIDRLLIRCLDWPESSIRRELTITSERLDYLLSMERPVLVVEAKRHSLTFAIPPKSPFYQIKLKTLLQNNPSLEPDVEQVQGYCSTWSVPYAALTNGKQLLVFASFRFDGKPWREGTVYVFSDLHGKYDYADLYGLLSRHAFLTNDIYSRFYRMPATDRAKSLISHYSRPNITVNSNPLGEAIEPFLQKAFADAVTEDSEDVLRNCYVYPAECRLREEELEGLLIDRPPQFDVEVTDIQNKNSFVQFGERLQSYLGVNKPTQIVFVIGGIGVGKTMFIRRFFEVSADEDVRKRLTYLYVDFRTPSTDPNHVDGFILRKLKQAILALHGKSNPSEPETTFDFESTEALEQMFWSQVQRLHTGPEGGLKKIDEPAWQRRRIDFLCQLQNDDLEFVKGAIRVLRQKYHRHVVVVIDNADVCGEEYQKAVYLYSRTLLAELHVPLIVSLREEWYWHFNRGGGPRTAYHDYVYHIPCPLARDVIKKRLDYAIATLANEHLPQASFQMHGFTVQAESLIKYLHVLKVALIDSEELGSFYECFANKSIRRGLDIFLDFIRSGHTETDVYLKALLQEGKYNIAFHQLFKSVARGSYAYYSEANSRMPNVYQMEGRLHRSHFHRLNVLRYLYSQRNYRNIIGDGFVEKDALYKLMYEVGFIEDEIKALFDYLLQTELIESDCRKKFYSEDAIAFRITVLGGLLSEKLFKRFEYLEMVMADTRIKDEKLLQMFLQIYKEGQKPHVTERVKAMEAWIFYLQREEETELTGRKGCQVFSLVPIGPILQNTFGQEKERIMRSLARKEQRDAEAKRVARNNR
jgi:hypothetical protein